MSVSVVPTYKKPKISAVSSPIGQMTGIVGNLRHGKTQRNRVKRDFDDMSKFLNRGANNIRRFDLPKGQKLKRLSDINIKGGGGGILGSIINAVTGGAGLLGLGSNLLGMADFANDVRGLFRRGGKVGRDGRTALQRAKDLKKLKQTGKAVDATQDAVRGARQGTKVLDSVADASKGLRGVSKANALLNVASAGLEFGFRKSEGQTNTQAAVGTAADAAGGMAGFALASKATATALSPLLVTPVPGARILYGIAVLGSGIMGSMAGSKLAASGADKLTGADKVGEDLDKFNQEQEQKKEEQEAKKKELDSAVGKKTFKDLLEKFERVVIQFEGAVRGNKLGSRSGSPNPAAGTPGAGNMSGPVLTTTGGAVTSLGDAAASLKGMSSATGPDGGGNGCVWAVNKVFAKAGIEPPWGSSLYVPTAEQMMIEEGYPQVDYGSRQPGDIMVMYDRQSPPQAHIGVVLPDGNVISNSSGKAAFTWIDTPEGYNAYYGSAGKIYRPNVNVKAQEGEGKEPPEQVQGFRDMSRTAEGLDRNTVIDEETGFTAGDKEDIQVRQKRVEAMRKALGRDWLSSTIDNATGTASVEGYSKMLRDRGKGDEVDRIMNEIQGGFEVKPQPAATPTATPQVTPSPAPQQVMTKVSTQISDYQSYEQGGGDNLVIMPIGGQSQQPQMMSGPGGQQMMIVPMPVGASVNKIQKELLTTKLAGC